jgi:hypothetical protein
MGHAWILFKKHLPNTGIENGVLPQLNFSRYNPNAQNATLHFYYNYSFGKDFTPSQW